MRVNDLLNITSNYSREEKKIILSFLLKCNKLDLLLINDDIDKKQEIKYKRLIKKNVPVQYLLKKASFLESEFYVNKSVLIPRPETEELVQQTNILINSHFKKPIRILDVGTGSGVIAISLKKLNFNNDITATDISLKALRLAKKNAKINKTRIAFKKSNMLRSINDKYDVIISNPPYLENDFSKIEEKVIKYEPHIALFGGQDGLKYYEEILENSKNVLNKKNIIAFEIGYEQKERINKMAKKHYPKCTIINKKDLNNFDRYVFILNVE